MTSDTTLKFSVGLIAAVLVAGAAYQAERVFAPLILALFIMTLVWPMQHWLHARMPLVIDPDHDGDHGRGDARPRLARRLGLRPGGAVADRRLEPLPGDL